MPDIKSCPSPGFCMGESARVASFLTIDTRAILLFQEIVPISAARCWTLWNRQHRAGIWHVADRHHVVRLDAETGPLVFLEGCFAKNQRVGNFRSTTNGLSGAGVKN